MILMCIIYNLKIINKILIQICKKSIKLSIGFKTIIILLNREA